MSGVVLSPYQAEVHYNLQHNHEFFAQFVQRIEPKDLAERNPDMDWLLDSLFGEDSLAGMVPLVFHPGQKRLHDFVTEQKHRRGIVRAALVKPRQVGWSTIIQARAHWLAIKNPGFRVQIVSHTTDSTRKFLRRVKKMCLASPQYITPGRVVDNARELVFSNGAVWSLATAGTEDAIRSDSFHFGHASEEAMWANSRAVMASFLPALSGGPGSEAYRESSSKGKGTPWHQFIMESLARENMWEVFFDPWFNHPRYQMTPPPGWVPNDEAKMARYQYQDQGVVLTDAQLYWRAMQIMDLRAIWLFKQEYPGTIDESFQSPEETLYNPDAVARAMANYGQIGIDRYAPLVLGVDVARGGIAGGSWGDTDKTKGKGDRTVLAFRQGNNFPYIKAFPKMDDMRLVGILAEYLENGLEVNGYRTPVAKVFVDYAIGEGVRQRLVELGYGNRVIAVGFGDPPFEERYLNKRAEMAIEGFGKWLGDTGEHVSIYNPQNERSIGMDISSDLLSIPGFLQTVGSERIKLPPKELIKKVYGKSPDIFDAMILTFAYPVQGERPAEINRIIQVQMGHIQVDEILAVMRDFQGRNAMPVGYGGGPGQVIYDFG